MPLPSQLSQLQHPYRTGRNNSTPSTPSSRESPHVMELSFELADSIQMAVQTLLQVSPPQILDLTKEQFSACSLSVPTSSMSAMFMVMKNINYISANMASYFEEPQPLSITDNSESTEYTNSSDSHNEFDIGEIIQCIGDSLSGNAAQAGVDLVIYHGDASLKHVNVKGDEAGLSYGISHIIRQILIVSERADTIELGLFLAPAEGPVQGPSTSPSDLPLQCTIRISHRFAFPERAPNDPYGPEPEQVRPNPNFSALLLRRILRQTSGTLKGDLPPPENYASGRTVELTFPLRRARSTQAIPSDEPTATEEPQFLHDPTLRDLVSFAQSLKGRKVVLYASPNACFAQRLTSYLAEWGMVVTHVSPDGNVDGSVSTTDTNVQASVESPEDGISFNFIDDDVEVLRERLMSLHAELAPSQVHAKKRPLLSNLHRPRSTAHVPHVSQRLQVPVRTSSLVIMHFTSLSNYKHLKDVVGSILSGFSASSIPLPEVMIIPKPAGPRRFLTALHIASTKPSVDLPFIPIATSPMSPGLATGSYFSTLSPSNEYPPSASKSSASQGSLPVSPTKPHRPASLRSNSDRSAKGETVHPPTPSPLSLPENAEYFAAAAQKLGATPSSGMVVQSPDGQPAGILFRPKASRTRTPSADKTQQSQATNIRRTSISRMQSAVAYHPAVGPSSFSQASRALAGEPIEIPTSAFPKSPLSAEPKNATPSPAASPLFPRKETGQTLSTQSTTEGKAASASTSPRQETGTPSLRRRHLRKGSQGDNPTATGTQVKKPKIMDNNVIPPISVLIVDDNPINQTILSTFMKRKKIKYDIANNGQEAVMKWRNGGFHLILMDIQMPIMDGIQATKEIRRMEKANALAGYPPLSPSVDDQRTPSDTSSNAEARMAPSPYRSSVIIVALTASSLQSDRDAALAAGCNDFLTKPVSLLWLNNKIIEWGSIKALQVWADIRPDVNRMNAGQVAQAKAVAERLQVPRHKQTPSPTPRRSSSLNKEEGAAALALASPAGTNLSQILKDVASVPAAESSQMSSHTNGQAVPEEPRPEQNHKPVEASSAASSGETSESGAHQKPGGDCKSSFFIC
ncbi:hypothetical protein FA15DRAFT_583982 [Coprinopsis marcescibilis]|uniref:Response regulatory domain-containing protein n=1 Tax=Coprinopsis marcescibilis TaxID=230819 RepID=A0A5C3LJC3_COPMA|nr:hypothetical protein FA15DRAFT_583982 [Coprinopsis marcescibilis]